MSELTRCKCGRYSNNGFLCTNCQSSLVSLEQDLLYDDEIYDDEDEFDELLK